MECTDNSINCTIRKLYEPEDDVMFSYVLPSIFIITSVFYIIGLYIQTVLLESKQNWATNMCVPKYMFISGLINKKPGEDPIKVTGDNFKKCVSDFKKLKFYEPDPAQVKDNYIKIVQAFGSQDNTDKSTDEMSELISDFLDRTEMTEAELYNASVQDIKNVLSSLGIQ